MKTQEEIGKQVMDPDLLDEEEEELAPMHRVRGEQVSAAVD